MKYVTKIRQFLTVMVIPMLVISCFKSEDFPPEPQISDAQVTKYDDSLIVSFTFQDGDADLGLDPADTTGVHAPGSFFYHNIYMDYYEKDDVNGWVPGLDLNMDTIQFAYRIKPIDVSENTTGIKGTMDVTVYSYANPFSTQSDTIKFKIRLIDRELNISNEIETPEIISE